MSLLKGILRGELHFADCAVHVAEVELPASFRKAYPHHNRLHITNHICFHQRCLLLLIPAQFEEITAEVLAAPKDRQVELFTAFFIGGAEEVAITNGKLPIPKLLLDYLGAYLGRPETATLCWLPPTASGSQSRSPGKRMRRKILVPA